MGAGRWWLCGHGEGTSAIETLKTQWHTCNKTNSDVTTCGNKWGCLQPLDHWIWLTNSTAVSGKMPCSWKIHPSNAFSNVWQRVEGGWAHILPSFLWDHTLCRSFSYHFSVSENPTYFGWYLGRSQRRDTVFLFSRTKVINPASWGLMPPTETNNAFFVKGNYTKPLGRT